MVVVVVPPPMPEKLTAEGLGLGPPCIKPAERKEVRKVVVAEVGGAG